MTLVVVRAFNKAARSSGNSNSSSSSSAWQHAVRSSSQKDCRTRRPKHESGGGLALLLGVQVG